MQYGNPDQTWKEWLADNTDRDEATKLGALREYIARDARAWADSGDIGPGWANKKLPKLGITDLIPADNYYQISAEITGKVTLNFHATNRSDALRLFADHMTNRPPTVVTVANIATTTDPVVVDGPEDPDPAAVAADAPQTVDATLLLLREIIMLGHVSGPKFCESGANDFLARYGLAPIPERKTFTV